MTPEEFRIAGHALIDWIADYRAGLAHHRVGTSVTPSAVRHAIPPHPPAHPEALAALLADLDGIVVPAITQVQHPRYFGWFPANASLASVLGDLTSSGLGVLGISWESAPALTELEEAMVDWLRQLVGLSSAWRGVITDTASTGVLAALLCARERATDFAQEHGGLAATGARLAVYTSEDAHSSVAKAVRLAGFGQDNLRLVPVDPTTRGLRADALREVMDADRARGWQPAAVVATVGTTATTAIDPVAAIVDAVDAVAAASADTVGPTSTTPTPAAIHPRPWVHVDAALAGSAMLVPECRSLWAGVEGADSLSWNPHKWLGTVLDCSLFHVRDVEELTRVFGSDASYLRSAADGTVTQYRDWGLPLGRRFRALKVWFHLRLDGAETIRARIRRDLDLTQHLAAAVGATPEWEVVAPVVLQTVCLRHRPSGSDGAPLDGEALDAHTLAWVRAVNRSGRTYLTAAQVDGRWVARVSIGAESTEAADVDETWSLIQACAHAVNPDDG